MLGKVLRHVGCKTIQTCAYVCGKYRIVGKVPNKFKLVFVFNE
jgi:hypothetical protein